MCICIFIGLGLDFNPFNLSPPLLPTRSCASSPDSLSPARDTASRRRPIRADSCRRSPSPSPPASRHPAVLRRSLVTSAASSRARLLPRVPRSPSPAKLTPTTAAAVTAELFAALGCSCALAPPRLFLFRAFGLTSRLRPRRKSQRRRRRLDRRRLLP
jgi:hypothetical protein